MSTRKSERTPELIEAGQRIWLARKAYEECRGIRPAEFMRRLQTSDNTLAQWENGDHYPRTPKLQRLNKLFGISSDWILSGQVKNLPDDLREHILARAAGTELERLIQP